MSSLKKYALTVQALSILIIFHAIFFTITKWFLPNVYNTIANSPSFIGGFAEFAPSNAIAWSFTQKILGFIVESISTLLLIYGFWLIIKLMNYFKDNQYFTAQIFNMLQKITKIALIYACYAPIRYIFLSVITTYNNQPGQRIIAAAITNSDIINIMVFCFLFLITTIFHRAYEIKHEQDLTI